MGIVDGFGDLEFRPEQRRDSCRRVPFHRQAAALRRSIECKRRDDCGATGVQGASKVSNVRVALLSGGKEMEDCAVVPHVHGRHLPLTGDVRFDPVRRRRSWPETRPRA